jgi:hypothetical protein
VESSCQAFALLATICTAALASSSVFRVQGEIPYLLTGFWGVNCGCVATVGVGVVPEALQSPELRVGGQGVWTVGPASLARCNTLPHVLLILSEIENMVCGYRPAIDEDFRLVALTLVMTIDADTSTVLKAMQLQREDEQLQISTKIVFILN